MISLRPFHFNVVTSSAKSRQEWIARACRIEELGYTTLVTADHLNLEIDPAVGLMAVADATSLRIGSHVFGNDFRHPIMLARQAAELDLFSEGRLRLGLGCGYLAEDYRQIGMPFDPVGVRLDRFEEALQIIKAYFHEEQVTFSGRYYQVEGLKSTIRTVQKPHPPIYIGGGGKRVLSIAAREADIVGFVARNNAHGLDWTTALSAANHEKLEWVRQAAGERFAQLEFSATIFVVVVTDHAEQVAHQVGSRLGMTAEQTLDCLHVLIGSVDQIIEKLQERRELFGISSIEVVDTHIETFAPIVARLAGK